jgi:hypothetical protein
MPAGIQTIPFVHDLSVLGLAGELAGAAVSPPPEEAGKVASRMRPTRAISLLIQSTASSTARINAPSTNHGQRYRRFVSGRSGWRFLLSLKPQVFHQSHWQHNPFGVGRGRSSKLQTSSFKEIPSTNIQHPDKLQPSNFNHS